VKPSNVIIRVVSAFAATSFVQVIAGVIAGKLIPTKVPLDPHIAQNFFYWMLLTNSIIILALAPLAIRSEWRGWKLGAVVASIPAAIGYIDGIEGMIFLKNSPIEWPQILLGTVISALLNIAVWALLFGRRSDTPVEHFHPIASRRLGERIWKFLVCDCSYMALYLIAGTIIFPYIKDFYATQTIPTPQVLFSLQLLLRGPAFVLLCILFTRMLGLSRLNGALTVGLIFTLLSGVAPLLMPNPYFPDSVRWMHFMEVTSSNFVFGAIVGWLWGQPKLASAPALAHAA